MSSWFTLLSTALGRTPLLPKNEFSASSTINIEMAQENLKGVTYAFMISWQLNLFAIQPNLLLMLLIK